MHGTRQAGQPELRFADLSVYLGMIETARQEAEAVLGVDPGLVLPAHAELARAVGERMARARPVAEEAG